MDKEFKFLDRLFKMLDDNDFFYIFYDYYNEGHRDYVKYYNGKRNYHPEEYEKIRKEIGKLIKEYKEEK